MLIRSRPFSATIDSLRSGELDLVRYVEEICDYVDSVDPQIHALLPEPDRRTRLTNQATAIRDRFVLPSDRPPLFGALVGVKDLFNVDGFETTAGSRLPSELFAGPESGCVRLLRSAGALVLGKTAMDEFAYCEPAPTRNPHNLKHTPGGSSSGSAAAVAAGMCPLAIGTQTSRSTIGPAAFCGVVGFKPSYGRIPTDGMILLSESLDTVGLFTQDVAGMALAASVVCHDWKACEPGARPVLGVPEGVFQTSMFDEASKAFEEQLSHLEQSGYQIRRVQLLEDERVEAVYSQAMKLLHGEMALVHADWFQQYRELYRPRTTRGIEIGQGVDETTLAFCRAGRETFRADVESLMKASGIDLWITPGSSGPAPEGLELTGWGGMTTPWSYAGMPCISLPAGTAANGLPLGLQLVAPFLADEHLLAWAETVDADL